MSKENDKGMSAVSPVEGGRRPTGTGETKAARKRFWAQHKTDAVLRLLRGEDIETLSRELGVTAAKISQWRDTFWPVARRVSRNALRPRKPNTSASMRRSASRPWRSNCSARRFGSWRQRTLWGGGGRGNEPVLLALHRSEVWTGDGVPCLGHPQIDALRAQGFGSEERAWPQGAYRIPQRRRIAPPHSRLHPEFSFHWRRVPKSVGQIALRWNQDFASADASSHAGEQPACSAKPWPATRPQGA